jgi:peroxiredoxin-like protein
MATVHEYPVRVSWSGGRSGKGEVRAETSGATVDLAVPPEFQGPGGASNPEELLTSAICGCYSITFSIIAENRKLPVVGLEVEAVGEVEQQGPSFTYRSVRVRPKITLAADATDEQVQNAEAMAHKADAYCIVTNAVRDKVAITVEPQVLRA